ncbi:TPA: gamma-glutamylcysteine synthetase [Streptococcus pneumoniae]|nr:gamma-glutamylcysteine synthetase putative [Streptococcus pneumoniae]HET0623030.1 gamma-glutamylcysteine synthetase [Streptococcus pneumoniae]HET0644489.1 gamma-glutamylcysteine synthetase [Streptococcus pneumoniae]HET0647651.1 gamma-glutamylcysteine synthetase [Streptococcus pneumoniae]HET0659622.1 gamma-glutamylcysteine synthetase [Streptococcus pneumoniae]
MSCSIDLLKHRYLKNIKENPELFVGIELEYPVASLEGDATDVEVMKDLFHYLVSTLDLTVAKVDDFGNLIQLVDPISQDAILFEVSYTTIEFAFGKAETIQEVENRFNNYMNVIQRKLAESNHAIVGCGIHPNWDKNENCPVAYPRYQMLMDYLNLSRNIIKSDLHHFPEYGTFICGSQVQLDISKTNYLRVINAFTQNDEADFFDYLNHSAIFTAERDGQTYYFYPIQAGDYLATSEIQAFALNGDEVIIYPQEKDFETHRSYQYQDLTTRGTVEFRSVCTQPLDRTFASAAFHLGLLVNLDKLEAYLETAPFFKVFGYDYKSLRRQFSKKNLTDEEETTIIEFSKDLLLLAEEGLVVRNKEEMTYLQPLREELSL